MASDGKGRSGVLWDVVTEVCKSAKVISDMFGVLLGGGGVERGRIEIIILCVYKITTGS